MAAKEPTYEQARDELAGVVASLEAGGLTLEQSLGYIADDEYVEVTPKSIRLRKIWLDPNDRKRMTRASVKAG